MMCILNLSSSAIMFKKERKQQASSKQAAASSGVLPAHPDGWGVCFHLFIKVNSKFYVVTWMRHDDFLGGGHFSYLYCSTQKLFKEVESGRNKIPQHAQQVDS